MVKLHDVEVSGAGGVDSMSGIVPRFKGNALIGPVVKGNVDLLKRCTDNSVADNGPAEILYENDSVPDSSGIVMLINTTCFFN